MLTLAQNELKDVSMSSVDQNPAGPAEVFLKFRITLGIFDTK
jgi:hypothetical protein